MGFRRFFLFFPVLVTGFLLASGARPSTATTAVVRCQLPDGTALYTDRRCDDAGATPQPAPVRRGSYPRGCARDLPDLLLRISSAIDNHDTNRLAGVYHWTGMSAGRSNAVMERLDRLARHPLVDLVPVMAGAVSHSSAGDHPSFDARHDPMPVALRIEQTLENGITPSNTVFGLRRHFGCLWIQG